jgi:hypothetical protein
MTCFVQPWYRYTRYLFMHLYILYINGRPDEYLTVSCVYYILHDSHSSYICRMQSSAAVKHSGLYTNMVSDKNVN